MDNFIFSLNATMPIFLVMVLGKLLMSKGFFTKEFTSVADKYVFKVALPASLFLDIASADIRHDFDICFVIFCMAVTTIMFLLSRLLAFAFIKDKSMTGSFTQACARGSAAVLGMAFVQNIYGSSGMTPMMIVAAVPLYNIYSVIALTFGANKNPDGTYKEGFNTDKSTQVKKAFINVLKNPIIIGIFLGIPFSVFNIKIPAIPLKAINSVASTSTPVALLTIGASFEGRKAISKIKPTVFASFMKLLGFPLLFLPLAVLIGFRNEELVAILIMLGAPTTVTSYIMAKNMGNDWVLSSSVVVCTTLFSSVTITLWIFVLRSLGYI